MSRLEIGTPDCHHDQDPSRIGLGASHPLDPQAHAAPAAALAVGRALRHRARQPARRVVLVTWERGQKGGRPGPPVARPQQQTSRNTLVSHATSAARRSFQPPVRQQRPPGPASGLRAHEELRWESPLLAARAGLGHHRQLADRGSREDRRRRPHWRDFLAHCDPLTLGGRPLGTRQRSPRPPKWDPLRVSAPGDPTAGAAASALVYRLLRRRKSRSAGGGGRCSSPRAPAGGRLRR